MGGIGSQNHHQIISTTIHMNRIRVSFFFLLAFLAIPGVSHAQTDHFEEMQRQMMEMQRQMMKNLQNNPFFGDMLDMDKTGKDSSAFFFRMDTSCRSRSFRLDTTFSNGSALKFFFGGDSTTQQFFQGFGHLFGDMMDMGEGFGSEEDDQNNPPKDDGHRPSDDGLLPEERIRHREEQQQTGETILGSGSGEKPKTGENPTVKKSKIKTTRI